MSEPEKEAEQDAVVCVRRSAWERVTEREELVGRFSAGSRFPQYLEQLVGLSKLSDFEFSVPAVC